MNKDFLQGFEQVTRIGWPDSESHWKMFAHNVSDEDRPTIEAGRFENGLKMNRKFVERWTAGLSSSFKSGRAGSPPKVSTP